MSQTILLPTPLRKHTNGLESIQLSATNVKGAIEELNNRYPGIKDRICEDGDQLRRFINIYVDGEDVRFLNRLETPLKADSEVSIILAIAGG
ncbi:MAG TPA: MoaD/ThiS family protein [Blastocatellia bacterium]|nr:MoaD/ThiS family protein [Blastocatellia bacterium]